MRRLPIPALGLLTLLFLVGLGSPTVVAQAQEHAPVAKNAAGAETKDAPTGVEEHKAEAAGDHKQPDIMELQWPLAVWTVFVFVGLLLILGRFAWKPLLKALHERESHLEQVLLDSERARNEAEAMALEHRRQLGQAADEVRALIEQARKEAIMAADSITRKAQAEAEAARERAEREISGARDQALMEIWSKTADLAVSVAGRVLEKELGESDHRRLIEVALNELPSNGQQQGALS